MSERIPYQDVTVAIKSVFATSTRAASTASARIRPTRIPLASAFLRMPLSIVLSSFCLSGLLRIKMIYLLSLTSFSMLSC